MTKFADQNNAGCIHDNHSNTSINFHRPVLDFILKQQIAAEYNKIKLAKQLKTKKSGF